MCFTNFWKIYLYIYDNSYYGICRMEPPLILVYLSDNGSIETFVAVEY